MSSVPRSENKTKASDEASKQFFLHTVVSHPKTNKPIHLLGTNHISKSAEEQVRQKVRELKPDTIVLELSSERIGLLHMPWPPSEFKFDFTTPIRSCLSYFYYKVGTILEVRPGGEFFAAFREGKRLNSRIILADRNFDVTAQRIFRSMTPLDVVKSLPFIGGFVRDMAQFVYMARQYDKGRLTRAQFEALVNEEMTSQQSFEKMTEDTKNMPAPIKTCLITERDRYIASVLRECTGDSVVGVFGGAHIEGIQRYLNETVEDEGLLRRELDKLPEHSIYSAYIYPASIPLFALGGVFLGYRGLRAVVRLSARSVKRIFGHKGGSGPSTSSGPMGGQSQQFNKHAQIRQQLVDKNKTQQSTR